MTFFLLIHIQNWVFTSLLHLACAVNAGSDYFLTTDDGILKKVTLIESVKVTDPIGFIKEV